MKRIRLGFVGCGEVVQIIHLPTLRMLPELYEVSALCDVSRSVVNGVGDLWSIPTRTLDYRDLLSRADVDAVVVTSPHAYHAEVTLAALEAGKHVLVEKPMCLTLREADAVIAAQRRTGLTVQVGYMRRYAPAFVEACRLVREMQPIRMARVHDVIGQNGLVIRATSRVLRGSDIPAAALEQGKSLEASLVREALGDAPPELRSAYMMLLGLSSHDISAMRELLGMPRGVLYAAQRSGGRWLTGAFDYGSFVAQFETGVNAVARFGAHLEVYGDDRTVRVNYETPYVRNLPVRLVVTEANGESGVTERVVHPGWGDSFVVEWQAFADNLAQKREPKTSPADFRQDLELFLTMIDLMR